MANATPFESTLFTYFLRICAPEFSLFHDNPIWESLIPRTAHREPCIYHASLAISALSLTHYAGNAPDIWPTSTSTSSPSTQTNPAQDFAVTQYNLAIHHLNRRLNSFTQSVWLAVFTSILFINIEFLQGRFAWLEKHLNGGFKLIATLSGWGVDGDVEALQDALEIVREQIVGLGGELSRTR
jgi:hypothetical protein